MTAAPPFRTYRLSDVPKGTPDGDIRAWFPQGERSLICRLVQASALNDAHSQEVRTCVATITFSKEPTSLKGVTPSTPTLRLAQCLHDISARFPQVKVDAHFRGITPLNDPTDIESAVDIIAVTGLGGRPFGSWQCIDDGSMWLQDAVPRAIPTARVLIYGYESKTVGFDSHATLNDFGDHFLQSLITSRGSLMETQRPLILIGHSLGGLVVKEAWTRCARNALGSGVWQREYRNLHRAIFGLIFFGTPHKGMQTDELIAASQGEPSEVLIRDLHPDSTKISDLNDRFAEAVRHVRIVSCAELRESPTLEQTSPGKFERSGPPKFMVRQDSAYLYWAADVETRIPIDRNHSMIAKLPSSGADDVVLDYRKIETQLVTMVKAASTRVPKRFARAYVLESLSRSRDMMSEIKAEATRNVTSQSTRVDEVRSRALNEVDNILHVLSDDDLSEAFLGAHAPGNFLEDFAGKVREMEGIVSQIKTMASRGSMASNRSASRTGPVHMSSYVWRRDLKFEESFTNQAFRITQALLQMLSVSMLRLPDQFEKLEENLRTTTSELSRIAAVQAMLRSSNTDTLPPLQGTLERAGGNPLSGLYPFNYCTLGDGPVRRVLVEYREYAKPIQRGQRRTIQSDQEQQQGEVTRELAKKLASLLKRSSQEQRRFEQGSDDMEHSTLDATTYVLPCLGYIDEPIKGRLAILFEMPASHAESNQESSLNTVETLKNRLDRIHSRKSDSKLPLEQKFQLAARVCTTVLNLHCSGWLHKSIRSDNVLLWRTSQGSGDVEDMNSPESTSSVLPVAEEYDVFLKGFEFAREAVGKSNPFESTVVDDLYRHPDRQGLPSTQFTRQHDLYAVGLLLLEIGEGRTLSSLVDRHTRLSTEERVQYSPQDYQYLFGKIAMNSLPVSMGSRYANAVVRCLEGDFGVEMDDKHGSQLALAFQRQVVDEVARGLQL